MENEWHITSDWDSHRPALLCALENTKGTVVELGCGFGSTQLLYDYCVKNKRQFWSFDTNKEWANKFWVITNAIDDYFKNVHLNNIDLLFVDCAPAEIRKELIEKYADIAKVIVVHDSEESSSFCYDLIGILSTLKYRINYEPRGNPHTTIISNFIDISKWNIQE